MRTDGKALLESLLRLYLDTADIIALADGKVDERIVHRLHNVLAKTHTAVLFRVNHAWDFHPRTDVQTRHRIASAFDAFPIVAAVELEPQEFEPYSADAPQPDIELGYVGDMQELISHPGASRTIATLDPVTDMVHAAAQTNRKAARASREVPFAASDVEMFFQVLVSLTRGQTGTDAGELLAYWQSNLNQPVSKEVGEAIIARLAPWADMMKQIRVEYPQMSGDMILAELMKGADPALASTAPGRFLLKALNDAKFRNIDRNNKRSDMVDLHHVQFLPYVDVFTADRENASILTPLLEEIPKRRAAILLRVGNLNEVADAVEGLAGHQ